MDDLVEIEIREFKRLHLRDAVLIDGFPSVGLVGTIAANYLIAMLKLDQIAAIDSEYFPPLSMVYASKPKFPARIYASEDPKVAIFISEFTPMPLLDRSFAKAMFSWALKEGCSLIFTAVGLPITREEEKEHPVVAGVGSTDKARSRLAEAGIPQLDVGIITGIPGTLLNEGRWVNFDVIALLVKTHPNIPDAAAAAKVIEVIGRLLPAIKVDVKPLYEEAERIEARLRMLRDQVKPVEAPLYREMYR